jgi:hypothetical protein
MELSALKSFHSFSLVLPCEDDLKGVASWDRLIRNIVIVVFASNGMDFGGRAMIVTPAVRIHIEANYKRAR